MMMQPKKASQASTEMHEDQNDTEEEIEDAIGLIPMIDTGLTLVEVEVQVDQEVVAMTVDETDMVEREGLTIEIEQDPIKGVNTLEVIEEAECPHILLTIEEEITEARLLHNIMMMETIEEEEIMMIEEEMYLTMVVSREVESICIQDLQDPVILVSETRFDQIVTREVTGQVEVIKQAVIKIIKTKVQMIIKIKPNTIKMMITMKEELIVKTAVILQDKFKMLIKMLMVEVLLLKMVMHLIIRIIQRKETIRNEFTKYLSN